MSARAYVIGQVMPVPADADIADAKAIQARRGLLERAAGGKSHFSIMARRIVANDVAARARALDPTEKAKTFLRRKGFTPVYEASDSLFVVGRYRFDSGAAMQSFAREKGWRP